MKDRTLSIFGITVGAFFAGIGLGYALQVWEVRRDEDRARAEGYEQGYAEARERYAPAGDQPGCRAAGEPFMAAPADTFTLCGSDAMVGITAISDDHLLRLSVAGTGYTGRPPKRFDYPAADRSCALVYYAAAPRDDGSPQARVGFECS